MSDINCDGCGMALVYRTGGDPLGADLDSIALAYAGEDGVARHFCSSCNPPFDQDEPDEADWWKGAGEA